jgi:multiple sugar transport system substrate-binding protein
MFKRILFAMLIAALLVPGVFAGSEDGEDGDRRLVINSNLSDPAPKAAFNDVVDQFRAEYPDIEVTLNEFEHESYKTAIRNFLATDAPDIALWFAGNRMKFFVDEGLFLDVSDVWEENGLDDAMASSMSALTVDGRQYGVPFSYYQWGIYYRTDLFAQVGAEVPETWDEFLAVCEALKNDGITPITIGTKYLWTAAGWFDYLNLRVNGIEYHMDLMAGEASYLDPELSEVFDVWQNLLDSGYFLENHATYSWQEAQAPLINGTAAMYLIGNFIVPDLASAGVVDNIGFFQFPEIVPGVGVYEDAPTDTYHIPALAENVEEAKLFLEFVSRPDIQTQMTAAIGTLAPNRYADPPTDRFTALGFAMLAEADGLAQFYDRDTDPEMASAGMEGFQEFMVNPDRLDAILERVDAERVSVFE